MQRIQVKIVMRRTFVAIKIPVSNQTVELINDIQSELKDDKIKWVESCNMHITLFFLGDTDEEIVNTLKDTITQAVKKLYAKNLCG